MKWVLIVLGILVLIVGVVLLIGLLLPKKHKATCSSTFSASCDQVWNLVHDFKNYTSWRSGLKEVKIISEDTWAEIDKRNDKITFKITEAVPNQRMVSKIIDETLPFGGSWIFELTEIESGTQLTITEDGEIKSPMFRFFAHFVFGYEATMKSFLEDMETELNPK